MNYRKILSMGGAVAITAGGLFTVAPSAWAKAPIVVVAPASEDVVIRRISYADLNLASAFGEKTLNGRVRGAVSSLCSEAIGPDGGNWTVKMAGHHCYDRAWDQARPQIGNAVERARQMASNGYSNLSAAAITISLHQ